MYCQYSVQWPFKVNAVDFGTNRKRVCDFLLVISDNLDRVFHRFRDTATKMLKITYFSYPTAI